jgi:hypothetical protein
MKWISMALTLIAAGLGLCAANLWYAASEIEVEVTPPRPADPFTETSADLWALAAPDALRKAGELNARAAGWTAAAVTLQVVASLVGLLA